MALNYGLSIIDSVQRVGITTSKKSKLNEFSYNGFNKFVLEKTFQVFDSELLHTIIDGLY